MATTYDRAKDSYAGFIRSAGSIGGNSTAVAPSDTVDFTSYPKDIWVTAAGNIVFLPLKAADDGAHLITVTAAPVGFVFPVRARRVMSSGTTASLATVED